MAPHRHSLFYLPVNYNCCIYICLSQTYCLEFCEYLLWLCQYSHILPISFRDQWTCAQKSGTLLLYCAPYWQQQRRSMMEKIHSSLPIDLGGRKEKEEKRMFCDHLTHRHNRYMPFTSYTSALCPFWWAYCTQTPLQSILLDGEKCSHFVQIS